jgi:hypothetical protein
LKQYALKYLNQWTIHHGELSDPLGHFKLHSDILDFTEEFKAPLESFKLHRSLLAPLEPSNLHWSILNSAEKVPSSTEIF